MVLPSREPSHALAATAVGMGSSSTRRHRRGPRQRGEDDDTPSVTCFLSKCKKPKVLYKSKRGLREHWIMKHGLAKKEAKTKAAETFADLLVWHQILRDPNARVGYAGLDVNTNIIAPIANASPEIPLPTPKDSPANGWRAHHQPLPSSAQSTSRGSQQHAQQSPYQEPLHRQLSGSNQQPYHQSQCIASQSPVPIDLLAESFQYQHQ